MNQAYVKAAGQPNGDAGDQYTGLDRFDRVVDQKWVNASAATVDDTTYTYDRDSNALTKNNTLDTALSDTYAYDGADTEEGGTRGGRSLGFTKYSNRHSDGR